MDILFGCGLEKIKNNLNLKHFCANTHKYACGEYSVQFDSNYNEMVLLHSLYPHTHENLWILQLIVQEMKARGVEKVHLIVPYLPYMRQKNGGKAVVNMLQRMGFASIHTFDTHDPSLLKLDNMVEYTGFDLLTQLDIPKHALLVAPDKGRWAAVELVAQRLELMSLCMQKQRLTEKELIFANTGKNSLKKDCIICDDIVDSSLTMCELARELKDSGAENIWAFVTHGVFSDGAAEMIEASVIDKVFVTDSIEKSISCNKVKRLTIAPLIEKILENIYS
jgi:ribose-phosphate pyrophosphokinase